MSSLSNLVTRGVRTLQSYLKGQFAYIPGMSFGLKALTSALTLEQNDGVIVFGSPNYIALGSKMFIKPIDVLSGSPLTTQFKYTNSDATLTEYSLCEYQQARIRSLVVTIIPSNKLADRQGTIAVGLAPVYTDAAKSDWTRVLKVPSITEVAKLKTHYVGDYQQRIVLRHRAIPSDATTNVFSPLSTNVFVLVIVYQDLCRPSQSTEFTADDCAMTVKLDGRVEVRDPVIDMSRVQSSDGKKMQIDFSDIQGSLFTDSIIDIFRGVSLFVTTPQGDYALSEHEEFVCPITGSKKLRGIVAHGLADMEQT